MDGDFCPFFIFLEVLVISNMDHQLNEEIKDKELRLIGNDSEQLGVVSATEALKIATEQGLDLVKIAPKSVPPVCRIMDYGKFRFEQQKREKEARKKQHIVEVKEIRLSPGIDTHDVEVKVKHALKFLKAGDKVKASVRFRGREIAHSSVGVGILKNFAEKCEEFGTIDKAPKLEGRQMIMFIAPKK